MSTAITVFDSIDNWDWGEGGVLRRYSLHFALPRVDGALLGEHEADVEEEDTTLSGLLDDLFGLPDGELVL